MIPKPEQITDNFDYEWEAYFMSYYFPKNKLSMYSDHESSQNKRFREWMLKFKDLTKDGEINDDFIDAVEFNLFKMMFRLFVEKTIFKNTFNQIKNIGLMHIPSHKKYSECKHNSISLLITQLCKEKKFIDMTKTIYRCKTIPKGTRDVDVKKESMSWRQKELEKINEIKLDHVIIIDDVCTSGMTALSLFEKIMQSDLDTLKFMQDLTVNLDVKFFAFGKTLSEDEIIENNFSDPDGEIFLPEVSNNGVYTKADNNKFRSSLKNINSIKSIYQ
tara:strand:+ start:467 stop:1288 length:822 start_codon:yes stop_codon:yes gene_type:complete